MKKLVSFMAVAAFASCLFAPQAQARPQYVKALKSAYSENKAIEEKKCGVCHGKGGMDKKVVSDYGKALAEAIGAKNCKDDAKLAEAIKAAGEKKEGEKTYAEILSGGGLPKAAE